jgi:putative membrane protein
MSLLIRIIITGVAVWVAALIVPGVALEDADTTSQIITVLGVAVIFGLVNGVLGSILRLISLPLTILTLGLFALVVNAVLFLLTAAIAQGIGLPFEVDGFLAALLGALVVSIVRIGLRGIAPER